MVQRLYAFVSDTGRQPTTRHFLGLPPELASDDCVRHELPLARVLVIDETPSGIFLYRYSADRSFAGDTWHPTVDEAQEQAFAEYRIGNDEWSPIPQEATDAIEWALGQNF